MYGRLFRRAKWPVIVESLSNMRGNIPEDCLPYVISTYDAILKNVAFKKAVAPIRLFVLVHSRYRNSCRYLLQNRIRKTILLSMKIRCSAIQQAWRHTLFMLNIDKWLATFSN